MNKVDFAKYNKNEYNAGSLLKRICWYLVHLFIFRSEFFIFQAPKRFFLRLFGAKVGHQVVIKPNVRIKYPWLLHIGNHVWIGEGVWIDNLAMVTLENHVCLSQGAMLVCGNHNYKKESFDLMVSPIHIQEGAWIGASAIVCGGVLVASHAILTVGSVANANLLPFSIYKGNPAVKIKDRIISD